MSSLEDRVERIEKILATLNCKGCGFPFLDIESINIKEDRYGDQTLRCSSCIENDDDKENK